MKIAFYTLGCKVNKAETEKYERGLLQRGYEIVSHNSKADFYIINTCTVTAIAGQKSRKAIKHFKKENPAAKIIAIGCLLEENKSLKELLEIDFVFGTKDRDKLLDLFEDLNLEKQIASFNTRRLIKIGDGCNNFCSYCIIPYVRGREVCESYENIIDEARSIEIPTEVVICGIHISNYNYHNKNLLDIVEEIAKLPNVIRIRLSSLEPVHITEEFVKRASQIKKLCPYFHISLQSGCDSVLKRMKRNYNFEDFFNSISLLRKYYDVPFISTDIITGFAGETDEEFEEGFRNIEKCNFSKIHVFPYSKREGTLAAGGACGEFISSEVMAIRKQQLLELSKNVEEEYIRKFIGSKKEIVYEKDGGYTDNYLKVFLPDGNMGELIKVKLSSFDGKRILGEIV